MIFFIQIQIHDRFVTVIKLGRHLKPKRKYVVDNKNEDEDFSGNFSWLFYPHFLLRLAHWLAISNQLQRWMTSAAFQRLSMTQRKTLQKAFAQVYNRHTDPFSFSCKKYLQSIENNFH